MADKFQLKALITGVDKLSPMLSGVRKNVTQLRKQLDSSNLGNIGFDDILTGGALAAPFVMGAKAAIGFESKMADVKKVVDFDTPAQFRAMSDDVLSLSERLPMAADGIAQIVAAGGQSGIARNELLGFAEDAVKMGVAFDLNADQAGDMMAKWRTAFKMGQTEVVALADQINYLGNTGPANAKQISDIVTSIGPLGGVAGMASGEIAAMGATLAGVGIAQDVAATGMKNFMLTLTAGSSATKAQKEALKALRLDAGQMAAGMQKDATGTINRILTAVSKVDKTKQASVLTELFGTESVGAIAPLLTNLDLLRSNFAKVADAQAYAGSMSKEYESRAATTANGLQLLRNQVTHLGINVGSVLLPPFNDFLKQIGPIISGVSSLASANPWLVKTLLGAAAGFTALRVGVLVATTAMRVFSAVTTMSPIGLIVRGIALGAGMMIANWETVGPVFQRIWSLIDEPVMQGWELFKAVAGFTPLGLIVENWEPIVGWFKGLWARVEPIVQPLLDGARWIFTGEGKAPGAAGPSLATAAPAPLAAQPAVAPIGPALSVGKALQAPNGAALPLVMAPSLSAASTPPGAPARLTPPSTRPALTGQAGQQAKAQLDGELVVRFEGAPPGTRVQQPKTNQPGLSVTPQVGYRSLGAQ